MTVLTACGSGGDDANNVVNNPVNNGGSGTIEVRERDGIPSDDFVDLLHYYFSTQEDGPGLYAYRPATPDAGPVYVDPDVTIASPFSLTVPIAESEGGTTLHLRPRGVFYNASESFPAPAGELPSVKSYVVTTDPSQLDGEPQQVSNNDYPGSFQGSEAYAAFGDSLETSSITFNFQDIRIDLDMSADEEPLALPEDGKLLATLLAEGTRSHAHWLYVDDDGTLNMYDTEFSTRTPVTDEDTGMPIENLQTGVYVTTMGVENVLVALADEESDGVGELYRVSRPTTSGEGVAKRLTNDAGDPIEFSLGLGVLGRGIPGEAMRWNSEDAFIFAQGASLLNSEVPAQITRVTADGWSAIEIEAENEFLGGFTPSIFVRVDGGFFWAPGFNPELIYPTADDPSSWQRTPLPDAPEPDESTTIFSSAGDWVYYQSNDDEAVAYNVSSSETVALADSVWVAPSLVSEIGEEIRTGLIIRQDLATVLVRIGEDRLGAVEAANPQDGVVILGDLPATTEEVNVNGPAIGPVRLVRIEHEDGAVEVVAIDTREAGSLRRIMDTPAVEWSYETTIGSTPIEMDLNPDATGPLKLF